MYKYRINLPIYAIEEQFVTYTNNFNDKDNYCKLVDKTFDQMNLKYYLDSEEYQNIIVHRDPFKVIFHFQDERKKRN